MAYALSCDMWPELEWTGSLADVPPLQVAQEPVDAVKVDKALKTIQERWESLRVVSSSETCLARITVLFNR